MWAPKWRSAKSMSPAAVSTGNTMRMSVLTTSMFQVKIGRRNIVIPGARIEKTVATRLTAVRMLDSPVRTMAMSHRSPPTSGERMIDDSGV